ncbi:MAG: hypothetical protein ACYSYV_00040 [Planctomycetota bacterium]|jgi:hypothetical protein
MKNQEVWAQYKDYTRDVTDYSRKLAFAGAAICWMLKSSDGSFSKNILVALAFFVGYFISDVFQSLAGALLLRRWIRQEEIKQWRENESIDGDYLKPARLDYPSFAFFLLKVSFLLVGFGFVGSDIFKKVG